MEYQRSHGIRLPASAVLFTYIDPDDGPPAQSAHVVCQTCDSPVYTDRYAIYMSTIVGNTCGFYDN